MLDVRPLAYIAPIAEQEIGPITPIVTVQNFADEDARICALFRIYRESLGILEYSSVSATIELAHGTSTSLAALTPFDPGAPADDDYFILCQLTVQSLTTGELQTVPLGQYNFDVKPVPMGPPPETHHTTHELGGMDPIDVTGMPGLLADPQTPEIHASSHEPGGTDTLDVTGMPGILAQPQTPAEHDIADTDFHSSTATPGQMMSADANGLPTDATNTNADVADAVSKRNCRANGEASNANPTPDADTTDLYYLSALADDATFSAPAGSPVEGQKLILRILDNGGARTLAWNNGAGGYAARGVALPTTTVLGKYLYVGFIYNAIENTWDCVATSQEA